MNLIDVIIVFFLVFAAWDGWRAGTLVMVYDLAAFATSLALSFFLYGPLGETFDLIGVSAGLRPFIGFFVIFVGVNSYLRWRISKRFRARSPRQRQELSTDQKIGGAILNFFKQTVALSIVINLLLFVPAVPIVRQGIQNSVLAPFLVVNNPVLEQVFAAIIEPAVYEAQQFITTKEIADDPVALDTPVTELTIDWSAEQALFDLVNAERVKRGIGKLTWSQDLTEVARLHSRDMWKRQYFAHINPDGADPFDRLRQAGIKYLVAGENLALAPSTPIAHKGLMDSPGHRENILAPDFGHVGIGVIRNGLYGAAYTQLFTE